MRPDKELTASKGSEFIIPFDKIIIDPTFNARKDFGDLNGLAKDIANRGLDIPLIVRYSDDGKSVVIIDGERRYRAIKIANEKKLCQHGDILDVRCVMEPPGTDDIARCLKMFSTGTNAKPLTDMEQAEVVYRLVTVYNLKPKEIAAKLSKSQTYVSHLLELHAAPHEIKQAVAKKQLSPTAAVKTARATPDKRSQVMAKVRTAKPGKKVKVTDVEKITKGIPAMISSKVIKDKIAYMEEFIKKAREPVWNPRLIEAVKEGLEIALGIRELPTLEE